MLGRDSFRQPDVERDYYTLHFSYYHLKGLHLRRQTSAVLEFRGASLARLT
jgi:hypothetical protein